MEFEESVLIQRSHGKKKKPTEQGQLMTIHCKQCNTVLADSLGVCGEVKCLDSIICLKVTDDVVVSEEMEFAQKGEMANCIYSSLKCHVCFSALGRVVHSAPPCLAVIRSIFLLCKANISCYILNSSSMVEASTVTFDLKPLRGQIDEVKQEFEAVFNEMKIMESRLVDSSVDSHM